MLEALLKIASFDYKWGTRLQIRDVVLQITIYCGAPAGLESLRLIREVFQEIDDE